jgi:hypothetical protein
MLNCYCSGRRQYCHGRFRVVPRNTYSVTKLGTFTQFLYISRNQFGDNMRNLKCLFFNNACFNVTFRLHIFAYLFLGFQFIFVFVTLLTENFHPFIVLSVRY